MVKVKICGIRDEGAALATAAAGADFIGLVFAESPRRVTLAQAVAIRSLLRLAYKEAAPKLVGLFVNAHPTIINELAAQVGLDYVQLAGNEPPAVVRLLKQPAIKSLRCGGQPSVDDLLAEAERWHTAGAIILLDAAGVGGGHGKLANWQYAAAVARRYPVMLAGGLTPGNVAAAIQQVQPWGVDVSSGVERERGLKDALLITDFIKAAQEAGS